MKKQIAFALVGSMLCTHTPAITVFERNSFSLLNISDIPQPVAFENQVVSPPGQSDGFAGSPSAGGPGGEPGIGTAEGDSGAVEGDSGGPGTGGVKEGVQKGEGAGDGGEGGQGTGGKPATQTNDRENRESDKEQGDKENRERDRENRERDNREGEKEKGERDRETRERERERESRERDGKGRTKDSKQKEDRSRDKKKNGAPNGPVKDKKGASVFRERSAFNLKKWRGFREIARLADGGSTASDMPTKYAGRPTSVTDIPLPYWPIPSTTIGTPSAHGADWTDVFMGVGVQNRARFGTLPNSTAIVGFGVGNSIRNVGLEIGISSYGLIRHGLPFTTGGISFKLHHYFRDWQLGIAAGYENAIYWQAPDSGQSFYLVFSKYFLIGRGAKHEPFRTLFVHLGLGDGRFRSESQVRAGENSISPFVAVAMRAADPVNLVLNWTGSDLAAGVSVTPFRVTPISVGLSALDLLHQAGDGVRFSMVFSYGDSVVSPNFPVAWFRPNGSEIRAR